MTRASFVWFVQLFSDKTAATQKSETLGTRSGYTKSLNVLIRMRKRLTDDEYVSLVSLPICCTHEPQKG